MKFKLKWFVPICSLVIFAGCNNSSGTKKTKANNAAAAQCNCNNIQAQNSANQSGYTGSNTGSQQNYTDPNANYQNGGTGTGTFLADLPGQITWEGTIQGIVSLKCISCHSDSLSQGGVNLTSYATASAHSDRIVQTIQLPQTDGDYMPPTTATQLTSTEKQAFLDWKTNSFEQGTATNQGTDPNAYQSGTNNSYGTQSNSQNNNGSTFGNTADANSCAAICAGQSANQFGTSNGQQQNYQQQNYQPQGGTSSGQQNGSQQGNYDPTGNSGSTWGN